MKKSPLVLTIGGAAVILLLVVFFMFIKGRRGGPDFIEAIQSGRLSGSAIESVEVVAPLGGSMPFTEGGYARLKRLARIDSPAEIRRLLECLSRADRQFPDMNHPVVRNVCYLRINTKTGWYWVYCDLFDDGRYRGLEVSANTLNATNPNRAARYFLAAMEDVLAAAGKNQ